MRQCLKYGVQNIALVAFSTLASLFSVELLLFVLDFPLHPPKRIAHPPNHQETRKNIEFQYVFHTNSRGLRNPEIPIKKPGGTIRIFVSGDSFVEGVGVESHERFPDLIADYFTSSTERISLINGGLAGTGPRAYGKLFLEVGLKFNPDALLICTYVNDVANSPATLPTQPFSERYPPIQSIVKTLWPRVSSQLQLLLAEWKYRQKTKADDIIAVVTSRARQEGISLSKIARWSEALPEHLVSAVNHGNFNGSILSNGLLYPKYWSDSIDIASARAEKKWRTMVRILNSLLDRAEQRQIETAVVLIPAPFQYDPRSHAKTHPWIVAGAEIDPRWLSMETEIQRRMMRWATSRDVPFLDLTSAFRRAASLRILNYEYDGHWNRNGHQVAADTIAAWLVEDNVFSFLETTRASTNLGLAAERLKAD